MIDFVGDYPAVLHNRGWEEAVTKGQVYRRGVERGGSAAEPLGQAGGSEKA
jgi:hypothetical protein